MLAFLTALATVPVLLSFALADDFRDAVFRSLVGIAGVVILLAAVTLSDVMQNEPPPSGHE